MAKANVSRISIVALAVSASLLCFSANAVASEKERINELEQRLDMLEVELIEAKDAASQVDRVKFSKSSPSPELISKDGRSTLEFKARIQTDYVSADELYTGSKREYEDSFNEASIRRIRFGLEGYFSNVWEYELEFDFDGVAEVEVKDANIAYKGWDNSQLTLGFQKYAFGLEATGSSAHLAFLERAATDTFAPDRALGAQWRYVGNNYNVTLGYGVNAGFDDDDLNFKQDIVNARFTTALIDSGEHLLHLGASALFVYNNEAVEETRYRARPNTKASGRTIDTGKFDAESLQHYGAEIAYQYSNVLLQAEYATALADQADDSEPEVTVDAYYLQAIYTLTGEAWKYKGKSGKFKTVKPDNAISAGGYGAWELAVRVDQANFDDVEAGIYGGKKTDYVLGVNWYLENNLKAQFNYVHTTADYKKPYEDINGDMMYDQDANIFQARLQFAF
ncbi:phosphate-selective porin O and P [Shewanella sediminis HAW-EB3]|uniref:Phosphate-selective porin O and P n=1 Tax=Shewanella sediminis (strain HAW-EB3) TaxID=425104 RepID=A8FQ57_SHESH|nr:porin [Shewanella sediminis]ABV34980.1 phosphate-selective porin O and P [Shewanella sediminis HAW-EB3]